MTGLLLSLPTPGALAASSDDETVPSDGRVRTPHPAPADPVDTTGPDARAAAANALATFGPVPAVRFVPPASTGRSARATDIVLTGTQSLLVDDDASIGIITMSGNATLWIGNDSRVITVTIAGSIDLYGGSALVFNNSLVTIAEQYSFNYAFRMYDSSKAYFVLSTMTSGPFQYGAAIHQNANLTVIGCSCFRSPSWFPVTVVLDATLYVAFSFFDSDIVVWGVAPFAFTGIIAVDNSAEFNVWLGFPAGSVATVTLPPAFTPVVYWEFPGTQPVTGIPYQIIINSSAPGIFATMQYSGSTLTVKNSTDPIIAFFPVGATFDVSDLREATYADKSVNAGGISLRLLNTKVFTWNFYPATATATFTRCDIGEVMPFGATKAVVRNSNITGKGGTAWSQQDTSLEIHDSTMIPGITTSENGRALIENTTVGPQWPNLLIAAGQSSIRLVDVTFGPSVSVSALDKARIDFDHTLHVAARNNGTPVANASLLATWQSNGTTAVSGATDAAGAGRLLLHEATVRSNGTEWANAYQLIGTTRSSLGELPVNITTARNVRLDLVDSVLSTDPADGATGVPLNSTVRISFGHAMDETRTGGALSFVPAIPGVLTWDAGSRDLTLSPASLLLPNVTYDGSISTAAKTATGLSLPGDVLFSFTTGAVPPSAPRNLTATAGNRNVTLRWDSPSALGGLPLNGYRVYRDGNVTALVVPGPAFLDFNLSDGLTNGRAYTYTVTALNDAGEGPRSAPVTATPKTIPGAPLELIARAGDRVVDLTWQAPSDNGGDPISGYRLYRNGTRLAPVAGVSYHDTDIANGASYAYALSAVNGVGEGPRSPEVVALPRTIPGTPQDVNVTREGKEIVLTWLAPADPGGAPVLSYRLYRNGTFLAEITSATTYRDGSVLRGSSYEFAVSAVNTVGEGPRSPSVRVEIPDVPAAPAELKAIAYANAVQLTWRPPGSDGGSPILRYAVYRNGAKIADALTQTGFIDANITSGKMYTYTVSASNVMGEGPQSSFINVKVPRSTAPPPASDTVSAIILLAIAAMVIVVVVLFLRRGDAPGPGKRSRRGKRPDDGDDEEEKKGEKGEKGEKEEK